MIMLAESPGGVQTPPAAEIRIRGRTVPGRAVTSTTSRVSSGRRAFRCNASRRRHSFPLTRIPADPPLVSTGVTNSCHLGRLYFSRAADAIRFGPPLAARARTDPCPSSSTRTRKAAAESPSAAAWQAVWPRGSRTPSREREGAACGSRVRCSNRGLPPSFRPQTTIACDSG